MKASLALVLSAVALVASVPVGFEDELERKVLAMGSACSAMQGALKTRDNKPGRFAAKCATCKAACCSSGQNNFKCKRYRDFCEGNLPPPCKALNERCPTCTWSPAQSAVSKELIVQIDESGK